MNPHGIAIQTIPTGIGRAASLPPDAPSATTTKNPAPVWARRRIVFSGGSSAASLQHALDEQARRIAQMLHDDTGQLVMMISLALDNLACELPNGTERLGTIKQLVSLVGVQLRRVAYELRPTILDHVGLAMALHALIDSVRQDAGLNITFEASLPSGVAPDVAIALYRIVQEGLTNALRHAFAENIWLSVGATAGTLYCRIEDDGRGFDVEAATGPRGGLGLLGMRERVAALAGTLAIASSPGAGTELSATIPLEVNDADHDRPRG